MEAVCIACEVPKPGAADGKFENFVVAVVQSCEAVPGKAQKKSDRITWRGAKPSGF